ncbi:MAG: hypothetical protein R3Y63_12935 [Eubacteriales bacterium]
MTREQISEIVSGVDMDLVAEAKTTHRLYSPKKMVVIGVAAALSLSLVAWTGNIVVKHLALGGTYTENHDPLTDTTSGTVSTTIGDENAVYEVVDGEIFFIYNGNRENITEQCSATDFFAYEEVDEDGNGFVILVGGSEGNLGQFAYNFENGRLFSGTGSFDGDGDIAEGQNEPTWQKNAREIYKEKFLP